jgi:eukaryotic-like serine/threonine-protein kinase
MNHSITCEGHKQRAAVRYLFVFLILALVIHIITPADARVFVYNGGVNNSSIQDIVNSAETGDSIFIEGGPYHENIVINRSVTLGAIDKNNPPEISPTNGTAVILLTADGITIGDLILSGNTTYGILIRSKGNTISNTSIQGFDHGIGLQSATRNEITKNIITNNSIGIEESQDSQENTIYLNYLNNQIDAVSHGTDLNWNGPPRQYLYGGKLLSGKLGNFWIQYNGTDTNGDGIGDTRYTVRGNITIDTAQKSIPVTDTSPLIKTPEYYTLVKPEGQLGPVPSGGLPPNSNIQAPGFNPPPLGIPANMVGSMGPIPDPLLMFWWIIPLAILISIGAGIWYEKARALRKTAERGTVTPLVQDKNATIVQNTPPPLKTGGAPYDDQYYSIRLPSSLEQKYPGAEYMGEGGIGRVFRATDVSGRMVAIKIPIRYDEVTGTHFTKELHLWQGLHHKNIVEIYSANIFPVPYIEIEYVGSTVSTLPVPVDVNKAVRIVTGVAEGLRYAHEQGIIHRDIKPENIMIGEDGTPKITDWGLAKAIKDTKQTGLISFSMDFAAPEQLAPNKFGDTGPWTDIYQLGVVFYYLITGQVPFRGEGMGEITHSILQSEPEPLSPGIPKKAALEDIIFRCLRKNPAERYTSLSEMIQDLHNLDNE